MDSQNRNENGKVKHVWTPVEDGRLVECLQELVNSGRWRADNGAFKPGYLGQLEKWMHEKIPGTKIKATPHIESRVKTFRKQYNAIAEMLSNKASGFGWSDTDKCIICEIAVFENWVQTHPNATGMGKRFPYLDELSIVFGKDRANGEGAESPADAIEKIDKENTPDVIELDGLAEDLTDPTYVPHIVPNVETQPVPDVEAGNSSTKKRRRRSSGEEEGTTQDSFSVTMQKFGNFFEETNKNLKEIASCYKSISEDNQRKSMVSTEVMKMDELTLLDRMKASIVISNDSAKTNAFFNFPQENRVFYVQAILNGDI